MRADAIVVGAGIVGAACAEALARDGLAVELLDARYTAAGATSAAMGHLVQAWRDLDQALLLEPGLLDDPAELFTRNTLLDEHQVATLVAYLEPFREARPTAKRLS